MKTVMAALALLAAAASPLAAVAAPTMINNEGMTPAEVVKWLKAADHPAELVEDKGETSIKSEIDGVSYHLYFYDCIAKPRCRAVQFSAGFDLTTPLTASKINEWNRTNRYLKAYIDDEGDPHVEYDVNLNAGRTVEGLSDDLEVWTGVLADFTEFIDW